MKKKIRWTLLMLMTVVVLSLTGCGAQKLSLKEYVSVTYEGYSGQATATVNVDNEGLDALVDSKKVNDYMNGLVKGTMIEGLTGVETFSQMLSFEIKGEKNQFANGDVLVIEIKPSPSVELCGGTMASMQEALGITLESTEIEVTVEGLEEAKILDVFGFVEKYIVYKGANGGADASIEFTDELEVEKDGFSIKRRAYYSNVVEVVVDHKTVAEIAYHCKYDGKLSEGQSFTIVAENNMNRGASKIGETGYIFNTEATVKVPKLGKYISSKGELTEAFKEEFAKQAGIKEYKDIKYYWGTIKKSTSTNNLEQDRYKCFALVTQEGMFFGDYYTLYETAHMIQQTDGTYDIQLYRSSVFDLNKNLKEGYDLEEIKW